MFQVRQLDKIKRALGCQETSGETTVCASNLETSMRSAAHPLLCLPFPVALGLCLHEQLSSATEPRQRRKPGRPPGPALSDGYSGFLGTPHLPALDQDRSERIFSPWNLPSRDASRQRGPLIMPQNLTGCGGQSWTPAQSFSLKMTPLTVSHRLFC